MVLSGTIQPFTDRIQTKMTDSRNSDLPPARARKPRVNFFDHLCQQRKNAIDRSTAALRRGDINVAQAWDEVAEVLCACAHSFVESDTL